MVGPELAHGIGRGEPDAGDPVAHRLGQGGDRGLGAGSHGGQGIEGGLADILIGVGERPAQRRGGRVRGRAHLAEGVDDLLEDFLILIGNPDRRAAHAGIPRRFPNPRSAGNPIECEALPTPAGSCDNARSDPPLHRKKGSPKHAEIEWNA
jgi:hypothetical protein